jgi:hypothetical protein
MIFSKTQKYCILIQTHLDLAVHKKCTGMQLNSSMWKAVKNIPLRVSTMLSVQVRSVHLRFLICDFVFISRYNP